MKNKFGLSLLVRIVSGCLIISVGLIVGAFFLFKSQKEYTPPVVEVTEVPSVDEQMDKIQGQVSDTRGLTMTSNLDRALMTTTELRDVVENDFFADYTQEDADQDVLVLSTLGLLEPDFDLRKFYQDLYAEQIAGYYDSETKEMYVIADGEFGGVERMTYAHEFTHVLQDQTYDLENGLKVNDDEYCENESEYCTAVSALLEGDATLSEQYWFLKYSTDQDKNQVSDFQKNYSSPIYDSAPYYMQSDFLFPYVQGFEFVNQIFEKGGWKAVDQAYSNLPVSTEQILHPEKYPDEKPEKVEIPDLLSELGSDWVEIDNNMIGEWYSYLILSAGIDEDARLSDDTAKDAANGWGGDAYAFYSDSSQNILFDWISTWDTFEDAQEFFEASVKYGNLRWGTPTIDDGNIVSWSTKMDGEITIRQSSNDVLWIIGSDSSLLDKALSGFSNF